MIGAVSQVAICSQSMPALEKEGRVLEGEKFLRTARRLASPRWWTSSLRLRRR